MAIPTIASITPATGPASGWTVVDIVGTGFRVRTVPVIYPPAPLLPPTVGVTFGGLAARYVQVLSPTLVRVMTPQSRQQPVDVEELPAVPVVLWNQSDASVPIPTEVVTAVAGFIYERAVIAPSTDPPLHAVLRTFIQLLKRELWRGTAIRTHPDYSDVGETVVVLAPVPSVTMRVTEEHDAEWRQWDNCREYKPTAEGWDQYRPPRHTALTIDLTLAAEGEGPSQGLKDCLIELLRTNPFLHVTGDSRWTGEPNDYPLDITKDPKMLGSVGLIEVYEMQVQVRGIPIVLNQCEAKVYAADEISLLTARMGG